MGWAGVITLLVTACFLLYRHPPTTWHPESPSSQTPPGGSTSAEPASPRATENKKSETDHKSDPQPVVKDDGAIEESQTTPKASASNVPSLQVPSLHLDSDKADSVADTAKQPEPHRAQNGSAQPPSFAAPKAIMNTPSLMPPPPPPTRMRPPIPQKQQAPQAAAAAAPLSLTAGRYPQRVTSSSAGSTLSPPPSAAASLRVPPNGSRPTSGMLAPIPVTLKPAKKASQRAVLEPGYSPLDWAVLTSNPNHKLRGANLPPTLIRVTPSMLKAQNGRKETDAWTSYQGKVYNITPYLPFHPGGKGELLRGSGKDSAKLFMEVHPWVNWDAILGECLVGILVSESEAVAENSLDAMD